MGWCLWRFWPLPFFVFGSMWSCELVWNSITRIAVVLLLMSETMRRVGICRYCC
jgi:hypothetical protein